MGPDNWVTLRDATVGHYVKGTLFDIPHNRPTGQPLRLKDFKLEVAVPYVYDNVIGAWGMFPHHGQVPLYFKKHIYAEFVLDMHLDYTSTPSSFYGVGGGHNHAHPGARRDPGTQMEAEPLLGLPNRTFLRTYDVAESS